MDQTFLFYFVTSALLLGSTSAWWYSQPSCTDPGDDITKYPHDTNCTLYWVCYQGNVFLVPCPDGLEFNSETLECDSPDVAKCKSQSSTDGSSTRSSSSSTSSSSTSTSSSSTTNSPTSAQTTSSSTSSGTTTTHGPEPNCPVSDELIYLPYEGDCSKYWECIYGDTYLYNCPQGLWWHQEILECDYPGDYCTNSTTTVSSTTSSPVTIPTTSSISTSTAAPVNITCPLNGTDVTYYPYPGNCSKFILCYEGAQFIKECPAGLWWHESLATCDIPGSYCSETTSQSPSSSSAGPTEITTRPPTTGASTSNGPTRTTASTSSTTSNPDEIKCPETNDTPVFFPNPGNCAQFWECLEGVKYLNECPGGLWWHQEVSKCDVPGDYCSQTRTHK